VCFIQLHVYPKLRLVKKKEKNKIQLQCEQQNLEIRKWYKRIVKTIGIHMVQQIYVKPSQYCSENLWLRWFYRNCEVNGGKKKKKTKKKKSKTKRIYWWHIHTQLSGRALWHITGVNLLTYSHTNTIRTGTLFINIYIYIYIYICVCMCIIYIRCLRVRNYSSHRVFVRVCKNSDVEQPLDFYESNERFL
jgi:hypothetical protein